MNQLIKHPHDRFAKLILSDLKVAKAFLMQHLPATLKNKVNLANLQPAVLGETTPPENIMQ